MSIFGNRGSIDVATVLMLLGEDMIWRAIWSRMRAQRQHWTHYIFTISPGWAPLAGSVFAAINGGYEPPNLIFSRVPQGGAESGLMLTNLLSGATHSAENTVLQTIWQTWKHGIGKNEESPLDMTKEIGVVDLDLGRLKPRKTSSIYMQGCCLFMQLLAGMVCAAVGLSSEVLIVLCVTLTSQLLLIWAITPRHTAWQRYVRNHRAAPILLHKGLDSSEVLLIRTTFLGGTLISLEEYCWQTAAVRRPADRLSVIGAGLSFSTSILAIFLISWMGRESKLLYFAIGLVGLLATSIDAAMQPRWPIHLAQAFTGSKRCAPRNSSLIASVAVLVAGNFPSAETTAKSLFPDNARFRATLDILRTECASKMCSKCRQAIFTPGTWHCERMQGADAGRSDCAKVLEEAALVLQDKQLCDAMATLSMLSSDLKGSYDRARIETAHKTALSPRHNHW